MKLGIKREKIGDIFVFEDGADVVVSKEISRYLVESIGQLTRFSKAQIEKLNISEIRKPDIKGLYDFRDFRRYQKRNNGY